MTTNVTHTPRDLPIATSLDTIGDGKIHTLTGVDFDAVAGEWSSANCIRFRLDGKIYVGTEDENDGYRSCLRDIAIVSGPPVKNRFPAVRVRAVYASSHGDQCGISCDILRLVDVSNGETVLEVGTDNTDDYYPSFVHWFDPTKLSVNAK